MKWVCDTRTRALIVLMICSGPENMSLNDPMCKLEISILISDDRKSKSIFPVCTWGYWQSGIYSALYSIANEAPLDIFNRSLLQKCNLYCFQTASQPIWTYTFTSSTLVPNDYHWGAGRDGVVGLKLLCPCVFVVCVYTMWIKRWSKTRYRWVV